MLEDLRRNNDYPQDILDLWEEKLKRWQSELADSIDKVTLNLVSSLIFLIKLIYSGVQKK